MRVTVVGAGYVGLVTAVGLASVGHHVTVNEVRDDRFQALQAGTTPIVEPGLQEAFLAATRAGRLTVTRDLPSSVDVVVICVGTPIGDDGLADLTQLEAALADVRSVLEAGAVLLVRSTIPVGSSKLLSRWAGVAAARTFTNPEFLRQGSAYADFLHPVRTVIGRYATSDPDALATVVTLMTMTEAPLLVVGIEDANVIKNGANAFLALKLSFANELSVLCEEVGADIDVVLDGIGRDPRIGRSYLRPSFGFGGSCLPKELRTLATAGNSVGLSMLVTDAISAANESHQQRFARRILDSLVGIRAPVVAVLGLAFKAGTDDVRSSPALNVASILMNAGVAVVAYDPLAGPSARRELPDLPLAPCVEVAMAGCHATVIATEWPEFLEIDWERARSTVARPVVFDGRRLLDAAVVRAAGFHYETIGSAPR